MAEDESAKRQRALVIDYQNTFSTEHGKRVLEILRSKYTTQSSHVPGDPYSTAFNEGARAVMLEIQYYLKIDLEEQKKRVEGTYEQ